MFIFKNNVLLFLYIKINNICVKILKGLMFVGELKRKFYYYSWCMYSVWLFFFKEGIEYVKKEIEKLYNIE